MTFDVQPLVLASLLAWASGLRLYFLIFCLGLAGNLGYVDLPHALQVLEHPWVIGAAGILLAMEFLVDKFPGLDSAWDGLHTFIRIPVGALLAAGAAGDAPAALMVAAGLLGGTITAGTHLAKAGGRAIINASPEPFSNWTASFMEDGAVITGIWLAFLYPVAFLAGLVLFLALVIWFLPKLWRGAAALWRRLQTGSMMRRSGPHEEQPR